MSLPSNIKYIGVNDTDIDLFEGQYTVPNGISYNSYIVSGEKTALLDTVDIRKFDEWEKLLDNEFQSKAPDYLVIHHLEPDHAGSIGRIIAKYSSITLVGNAKTFAMLPQFFDMTDNIKTLTVKEGDTLDLGGAVLTFVMAPMVHWPEVMVSYESESGTLFSADAFGKFGIPNCNDNTVDEMRRYFINIVGKYGSPVQALLKKAASLDIKHICALHGPIVEGEDIAKYVSLYDTWSKYESESDEILIAYASIYGNTKSAAFKIKEILEQKGQKVIIHDVAREPLSICVSDAFKVGKMICAAPSYDASVFPPMNDFINHLKTKTYQNKTVAFIENGSWAPCAARVMSASFDGMKNITLCTKTVTIKSALKDSDIENLVALADEIAS